MQQITGTNSCGTGRGTSKSSAGYIPANMANVTSGVQNYRDFKILMQQLLFSVDTFNIYIKLDAGFIWEINENAEL